MILGTHKLFILLTCIGILAIEPYMVCGIRSIGIEQRLNRHMLNETVIKDPKANLASAAGVNKKFNHYQSSKRTVKKGSDPIHNRV